MVYSSLVSYISGFGEREGWRTDPAREGNPHRDPPFVTTSRVKSRVWELGNGGHESCSFRHRVPPGMEFCQFLSAGDDFEASECGVGFVSQTGGGERVESDVL